MAYTPIYEKPYENGWEDLPSENTPATADILDQYDDTFEHIEEYLEENPIIQTSTMPTASEDELGHIYQYMGETTLAFTQGYFYKCVSDEEEEPSYSWENINVQSGGGGGTTVVPNPVGEPTDDLETIQIGNTIYDIPGGGGGNANIWTGTKAEYEAQASQIADDTVVLITDDEERTQSFDVYSTDEQVIGTWLGKPLYRKVIEYNNTGTITHGTVITSLDPTFDIKYIKGGMKNTNTGRTYNLPYGATSGTTNVIRSDNSELVLNITGTDTWSNSYDYWYFVLEYTKTTD